LQLVIADTGPVNYLILIGHIDLLPRLFQRVILLAAVKEELIDAGAPDGVRDERKGVKFARNLGLRVTGTLGLLELAAQSGFVNFVEAADRLRQTTFRSPEALIDTMIDKHRRTGGTV